MDVKEGSRVFLKSGDIFKIGNDVKTGKSCTVQDAERFLKNGEVIQIVSLREHIEATLSDLREGLIPHEELEEHIQYILDNYL